MIQCRQQRVDRVSCTAAKALACVMIPMLLATLCYAEDQTQLMAATDLQARLAVLQLRLTTEQQSLDQSRQAWLTQQKELKRERRDLAQRVLDLQLHREALARRQHELEARTFEEAAKTESLDLQVNTLLTAAQVEAQKLQLYLYEIPGSLALHDQTMQAMTSLRAPLLKAAGHPLSTTSVLQFIDTLAAAYDQATRVSVMQTSIYTSSGLKQQVSLLAVGHLAFAYETEDGGHISLAMSSPSDATGYRWTQSLGSSHRTLIRSAIRAVRASNTHSVSVPMDVTGQMQPSSLLREMTLTEQARSGGPVMIPLGVVAILAVVLAVERVWVLYGSNHRKPHLTAQVINACRLGKLEDAHRICQAQGGAVFRTLASCLGRHSLGQRAMEESIQEQLLHEQPLLQRSLGGIAILAAVAPLLGLLGTVTGIITTFSAIRVFGHKDPGLMAGGISEALVTTAAGLIIAIPILLIHSVLSGRMDKILSDAEKHAAEILNLLSYESE